MCGIAGFFGPAESTTAAMLAQARRMADAITHRGPDSDGYWADVEHGIALAQRRLAIVDLSPQGAQPMRSFCGRYMAVYNGEIYNHPALRAELGEALPWRGHSDTETLLAAFTRWGIEATLPRLVGMFAIAVWDREQHALTLVRDRLGEKPLYWGRMPSGTWLFGSELKALRAHEGFSASIDRAALAAYLRHAAVPAQHTIHTGVHKLQPGCWVRLGAGAEPVHGQYWSLSDAISRALAAPFTGSDADALAALEALLGDAVAGQLMSDVPLGAFLSGGVDSSAIVALMVQNSRQRVRTYSIGFDEAGFDESAHAKRVAEHLGTDHTELKVRAADALALVPSLPRMYDEPFADSSQIPTALLARLTRQHVTVALSGDGGDELFAGYNRYWIAQRLWGRLSKLPLPLRRAAAAAIRGVAPRTLSRIAAPLQQALPAHRRHAQVGEKLHKFADGVLQHPDLASVYRSLVSFWPDPALLVAGVDEAPTALHGLAFDDDPMKAVAQMGHADLATYLPDDILVKVDRAAMAASLETRVPLLDHRVVEFTLGLPMGMKIRDGQTKWLLRQLLYRHVPRELIERPKQGFAVPLAAWLRGPLRDWAEALLSSERLARDGLFEPGPVRQTWSAHLAGQGHLEQRLWCVLMAQAWVAEQTGPSAA